MLINIKLPINSNRSEADFKYQKHQSDKNIWKGPPCQKTSDPDGFIGKVIQTLERNILWPTLHSIDIPGDFLSLFYKDSIALILKSTKDKNKNGTTVQLTMKNEIWSSYLSRP